MQTRKYVVLKPMRGASDQYLAKDDADLYYWSEHPDNAWTFPDYDTCKLIASLLRDKLNNLRIVPVRFD